MIRDVNELLIAIRHIHEAIRNEVIATCERSSLDALSMIVAEQGGDTIFAIDRVSEEVLLHYFEKLSDRWSFLLVAEGLGEDGRQVFPAKIDVSQAELVIIIDPIDGTRGIMYQKRAAWILTGVAPNRGAETNLSDIELAIQTEIPLVKQHLSDSLWAVIDQEAQGERYNRITGARTPLVPQPSQAQTIAQGYGNISRFFPGIRAELAAIDDDLIQHVLGPNRQGEVQAFEDQYICSGGQLYELIMGHDRWIADLRPLVEPILAGRGQASGLFCHPYDLCTELIARKLGIIVTDAYGQPLAAPLDVSTGVSWIGYANSAIQKQITSTLTFLLEQRGLLTAK
jgi:fructose-1,6-bisphosphatase/inositol monophosphatase family enzyme